MPIYAYKCSSCGHARDVLQKVSDAPLTQCPECGAAAFAKQVTAAGFQLKGSGWYVTDFRDNGKKKDGDKKPETAKTEESKTDAVKADAPKPDAAKTATTTSADSSPAPAPASAPAPSA